MARTGDADGKAVAAIATARVASAAAVVRAVSVQRRADDTAPLSGITGTVAMAGHRTRVAVIGVATERRGRARAAAAAVATAQASTAVVGRAALSSQRRHLPGRLVPSMRELCSRFCIRLCRLDASPPTPATYNQTKVRSSLQRNHLILNRSIQNKRTAWRLHRTEPKTETEKAKAKIIGACVSQAQRAQCTTSGSIASSGGLRHGASEPVGRSGADLPRAASRDASAHIGRSGAARSAWTVRVPGWVLFDIPYSFLLFFFISHASCGAKPKDNGQGAKIRTRVAAP